MSEEQRTRYMMTSQSECVLNCAGFFSSLRRARWASVSVRYSPSVVSIRGCRSARWSTNFSRCQCEPLRTSPLTARVMEELSLVRGWAPVSTPTIASRSSVIASQSIVPVRRGRRTTQDGILGRYDTAPVWTSVS